MAAPSGEEKGRVSPSGGGIQLGSVLQQRSADRGAIFGSQLRRIVQGPQSGTRCSRPEMSGLIWLAGEKRRPIWVFP